MNSEHWQRVKQLLEEYLEKPQGERSAFLDHACAGDTELRDEVESLAGAYESSDDLLEEPALGGDAGMIGRRIGPYRIVEEIGEGGMSRVYLGVRADDAFRKNVAIKLVKRGMDYEFILRRFRHERQIMASLDHSNIARLLDGGSTAEGVPYFVMEHIEGRPIDEHCDEQKLSVPERLELFRTVCSAVAYAHERRIIHRDIKPGNILITAGGIPKLLDFGIAKILDPESWTQSVDPTASVLRLMTPEYASPEQVRGAPVSEATDVYSLGVLLYELLTGHRPYRLSSRAAHEVAQSICDSEPIRPSTAVTRTEDAIRSGDQPSGQITPEMVSLRRRTLPNKLRRTLAGDLDNIVLMAMRKEPERRYASAAAFSEDIRRYLEGRPVAARKDTLLYRTGKALRRNSTPLLAAAGGVAVAAVILTAVNLTRDAVPPAHNGSAPVNVVPFTTLAGNESQPAFSPDGQRIAFVWAGEENRNSDIYIKPLQGGELQRVTTDPAEDSSPSWSPDGTRIAFLRMKKGETAVFLAPLPRGPHGMLTEVYPNRIELVGRQLDWSPDGRSVALADKRSPEEPFGIYLVRVSDGVKQSLTAPSARTIGDSSPAFSPDGKYISFLRSPGSGVTDLYVTVLAGGKPRRVTFDNRVILAQCWSQDGKSILFSSNRTGGFTLWKVSVEGGKPQRMQALGDGVSDPSMSPDGRHLAYSQFFQDTNIWQIQVDGARATSPARKLISSTQYDSSPQFSPDGSRVAFRSNRGGSQEIWIAGSDGRNASQLTHFAGPLTGTPRWSPDGKWIAFDSRPEGQADIYVVEAAGGTPRRVTEEMSEDVVPSWSRDGKWIYFASNRSGVWQVWKAPVAGGTKVQVTRDGGFAAFESVDGRYLYYARGRNLAGLYRMPLQGGNETLVMDRLRPFYWGYWAPGRQGIYFAETRENGRPGIYFYDLAAKRASLLADVGNPFIPADSAFALSPDERTILYTQIDQSGSDIMLADMGR